MRRLLATLALAAALPARAAELPQGVVLALQHLHERLARLEARNAELERQAAAPVLEGRVKQLETALASARLSQDETDLATRLKAVEFQSLGMQKQARRVEALEGIAAGVSFTTVAQHANAAANAGGRAESQLSWRGDAQISLPGGNLGHTEGDLFFHFRMGQGEGLSGLNPMFSAPNASAFQLGGTPAPRADNASPILAQAWYQLHVPLEDKSVADSREHLEITFGKIDPFLFFDQNAAADDETTKYLNLAFVHNPLLDAGGGAGLDAYGFTPGLRLAYQNDQFKPVGWGASLGVFGSGGGAAFADSLKQPFAIAQIEGRQKFFGGLDGNYRLYAWRNGRAIHHDGATREAQSGWGLSVDQRLGDGITLWGRYGHGGRGHPAFDRALTLGAEVSGNPWSRGADSLGLALGWLAASDSYAAANPGIGGGEQLAELYYRWRINPQFGLTPDYQFVRRPGGNGALGTAHILGLRAQITF